MNKNDFYQPLPWYKSIFVNIKTKITDKIDNFKFPWKKLLILVILALIILTIYLLVVFNKVTVVARDPYDKTGFIRAEDYLNDNGNDTILENSKYKFTLNNKNTTFVLDDKSNNISYRSNPDTTSVRFLDTLIVYYSGSLGSEIRMGVYDNAIIQQDYMIRLGKDSIEVLYEIGGKKYIDKTDFPEIMNADRMEEKILSKLEEGSTAYRRVTEQVYVPGELNGQPVWKMKDGIQTSILNQLYKIFYEDCGYTIEDLHYDLALNNIVYEDIYAYIEVAIKYTLTDEGFDIELINESIVEKEKYPLIYIDVLPYFASAGLSDTGYIVIPDGSGILIDFNNNRSFALRYNQRIYGKELARKAEVMVASSQTINLPLYGMKINDNGFISIVEEGAEMAGIISNISTVDNPYNQAYYRYYIREGESFTFDSINSSTVILKWTDFYNTTDLKLSIKIVDDDGGSYSAMAKKYREYLIGNEILSPKDNTNKPVVDLTLLGGYLIKENFIGFPYTTVRSLTNPEETKTIIDELINDNIEDINVIYQGWSNDGMKPRYMGKVKYNSNNGSKKDFYNLQEYFSENSIDFYPEVLINTAYTDKSIRKKDIVRDVFGKIVRKYSFNEATLVADYNTLDYYYLQPTTYNKTLSNINKHFNQQGFQNIGFGDFGSNSYGSYEKKNTIFRSEATNLFYEAMDAQDFGDKKLLFNAPNLYALQYADKITNLPTYGTNYQIIATSIPFYQLVLSGYLDYSSYSFNIDDRYSINWHRMKAIETLSNISLTWSYKSTIALVETEYSHYYSTYYKNWYDTLIDFYNELDNLGIYQSKLLSHELLSIDGNISKSIYQNGTEIVFNYGNIDYSYNGIIIPANGYKVVKEAI